MQAKNKQNNLDPKRLTDKISQISNAIKNEQLITIDYEKSNEFSNGEKSRRKISPIEIVTIGVSESVCVRAWCFLRDDERTFALDRIKNMEFHPKSSVDSNKIVNIGLINSIETIKAKLDKTKNERVNKLRPYLILVSELNKILVPELRTVSGYLGLENNEYQNLADDVAEEITQCVVDFYADTASSVGFYTRESASKFLNYGYNIASRNETKQKIILIKNDLDKLLLEINIKQKKSVENHIEFIENSCKYYKVVKQESIIKIETFMIENKRRLNSIYDSLAEFENIHLNLSSKVVDCALKLIYQYLKLHQIEFGTLQLNIIELNTERRLNVLEYISKNRLIPIFELTLLLGRFRSNEAINQKVIELHREVGVISKKLELNLVDPTVAWRTKLYELTRQELNELIQANFTNEELMDAEATLTNLKKWKPFRTKEKRCVLIEEQLKLIDRLKLEEKEKIAHAISNQGSSIVELEDKLSVFHQAF